MDIKKQNKKYIDSSITTVFHFLQLKGQHNFLIGSKNIRNILYSNDYDLNSNIGISDTIPILKRIHKEFLSIFEKAYKNPDYYIIDFKNGIYNNEPIRWEYHDIQEGFIHCGNRSISFEECLMMDNNVIKLDMCFLNNGIMTDINCLYNLFIVHNTKELDKEKAKVLKQSYAYLKNEITELKSKKEYYKAMKRYISLGLLQGKVDKRILELMNSDLGIYYKFISFLRLVIEVINQNFKPIDISIIKANLEYIKQFASSITTIEIEPHLNRLVTIIEYSSNKKIKIALEKLVEECSRELDNMINKVI